MVKNILQRKLAGPYYILWNGEENRYEIRPMHSDTISVVFADSDAFYLDVGG